MIAGNESHCGDLCPVRCCPGRLFHCPIRFFPCRRRSARRPPAAVDVSVVTPTGSSPLTSSDQFTYTAASTPTVTSLGHGPPEARPAAPS